MLAALLGLLAAPLGLLAAPLGSVAVHLRFRTQQCRKRAARQVRGGLKFNWGCVQEFSYILYSTNLMKLFSEGDNIFFPRSVHCISFLIDFLKYFDKIRIDVLSLHKM